MDTERWEQRNRERMERQRLRMERRQARWDQRSSCGGPNASGGLIIGLCVIAVGVLFLLKNVGILYFDDIWQYWPVILIVIGISKMANTQSASQVTSGIIMGGLGTVFLLRNLGYIYGNIWEYIWPGILIAVGLSILVKHLEGRGQGISPESSPPGSPPPGSPSAGSPGSGSPPFGSPASGSPPFGSPASGSPPTGTSSAFAPRSGFTTSTSGANYLHVECVFSGIRQRLETQDFLGGKVTSVFGGAEIDLRGVKTNREEISIKAEAVFGGIELWVPAHWQTIVRGSAVFGSFEDKTWPAAPGTQGKAPRLVITGAAVFGSVIVKN